MESIEFESRVTLVKAQAEAKAEGKSGSFLVLSESSVMYMVCYAAFLLRFTMI